MGSYLKGTEFQFCQDGKSSGNWLHNNMNVINSTELHTQK